MRAVYGDLYVAKWVAHQLGQDGFVGNLMNAFGTFDGDGLIGGVVFHNYYPDAGVMEMTAASTDSRWLTKKMIRAMFGYVFDVIGCQMAVLRVSAINSQMLNIADRFGFKSYLIPRLRGRNEDEVILTYTDDQWRESRFNRSM